MNRTPVVFDLYGTLLRIDGLRDRVAAHVPEPDRFVEMWRNKQIQYAWTSTLMGTYRDFDELTAAALDYTAAVANLALDARGRTDLLEGWRSLEAYPDVAPTLKALREGGVQVCVFTNGVHTSVRRALTAARIDGLVDRVLTVEPAREYKPSPRVYQLVVDAFATVPSEIRFVSSNAWDACGAATFGFRVALCNRTGAPFETMGCAPEHRITSLSELIHLIEPASAKTAV